MVYERNGYVLNDESFKLKDFKNITAALYLFFLLSVSQYISFRAYFWGFPIWILVCVQSRFHVDVVRKGFPCLNMGLRAGQQLMIVWKHLIYDASRASTILCVSNAISLIPAIQAIIVQQVSAKMLK